MLEFFKNAIARVYYDEELDSLFLEYLQKVPNDAEFIKINSEALKAFKELNTQIFVADIRKMGIISVSSQKWVAEVMLPGMFKHLAGKKLYHAQYLDPDEVFSRVSAENVKKNATQSEDTSELLQFSQFSDMSSLKEALLDWKAMQE